DGLVDAAGVGGERRRRQKQSAHREADPAEARRVPHRCQAPTKAGAIHAGGWGAVEPPGYRAAPVLSQGFGESAAASGSTDPRPWHVAIFRTGFGLPRRPAGRTIWSWPDDAGCIMNKNIMKVALALFLSAGFAALL